MIGALETHSLLDPTVIALQEAYVRQVVDAVNDLDNVLYEISNESREVILGRKPGIPHDRVPQSV